MMRPPIKLRATACALVLCIGAGAMHADATPEQPAGAGAARAPALFSAATLARADALLAQMTVPEKLGQLNQLAMFKPSATTEMLVSQGKIGSLLSVTEPADINRMQRLAVEGSRLHIPLIFGYDVIHGHRTIFPVPLAIAASWDPALSEQVATMSANEARAFGVNWTFSPMVDISRDPRWGRMVEGAGEDPYLGSAMAAAQVRGLQGPSIGSPGRVLATVKHLAGYSAAEGGRDYDGAYLSDTQLQNVYLPPYRAAVNAGAGTVLSAYMDLNDVPASGNTWLLRDLLRQQWGFQGFVVSDYNSVKDLQTHGFARDREDAAARALNAGVDMEMAEDDDAYQEHLADALAKGRITPAVIDAAVRPILAAKIQLGLFEHPYVEAADVERAVALAPQYRSAARVAAERSAVLLRNQHQLLPLAAARHQRIAVIGPLADAADDMLGPWVWGRDPKAPIVTVAAGIRARLGPAADVTTAPGVAIGRQSTLMWTQKTAPAWDAARSRQEFAHAVALARAADVVVLVLGEHADMSGEAASVSSLALAGGQQRLMEAVSALGKPVVLMLVNGRPLDLTWASAHVPAIVELWFPGAQGGAAAANLLFGDAAPGGKLPFTWPRSAGQVPIYYAHNLSHAPADQAKRYWDQDSTPLYPFGYGLGYSQVAFSDVKPAQPTVAAGQPMVVTAVLENTGAVSADEVAQLYIHQRYGSASRPVRELKGFQRVTLAPHEKRTLHFTLTPQDLGYWSPASRSWVNEATTFDVWVGADSTATSSATFEVTAE